MQIEPTVNLNLVFAAGSFLLCLLVFPLTIGCARAVGLLDVPTDRKRHQFETPLVGGITVFCAFFLVSTWFANPWLNWSMLFWMVAVVVIGAMDDYWDVSQRVRILVHAIIIVGIAFTDGLLVYSVGDLFTVGDIELPLLLAFVMTVFAVVGAVNAVNMTDGMDGLLGSLAVVSFLTLLLIGLLNLPQIIGQHSFSTIDISSMLGALLAFLLLNSRFFQLKRAMVFMGDAGSTAIGFCLVFLLVDYSQGEDAVISPVTAGWILGWPLLDASAVIAKRVLSGRSPVKAGRDHLHHMLFDAGFGVNQTVALLTLVHTLMVLVGVSAELLLGRYADAVLFWSFVVMVIFRIFLIESHRLQRLAGRIGAQSV